ncbi:MAG: YeeE/YedE thiosulfate transporter family protein [Ferruginibacter sp.]
MHFSRHPKLLNKTNKYFAYALTTKRRMMLAFLKQPWPWYVAGPLIGLMVPVLLILGNKSFGISSSLRHICAIAVPAKIPFFSYDWKKESWNLFLVLGILLGGFIAMQFLANPLPVKIGPKLATELAGYGIDDYNGLVPTQLFNWHSLFTLKGILMMVLGGFMVGFGTRYAGGCTSGHAIMGLATLQWPSLVATCCFMIGGFIMANLILPLILSL